jgi:hypothetical protein
VIEEKDIWTVEEVFDDDTIQIVNDDFKMELSKNGFDKANKKEFIELARLREELLELEKFKSFCCRNGKPIAVVDWSDIIQCFGVLLCEPDGSRHPEDKRSSVLDDKKRT